MANVQRVIFLGPMYSGRSWLMKAVGERAGWSSRSKEDLPYPNGEKDMRRLVRLRAKGREVTLECVAPTVLHYSNYCRRFVPGAAVVMALPFRERDDEAYVSARDTGHTHLLLSDLLAMGIDPYGARVKWVLTAVDRPESACLVKGIDLERVQLLRTSAVTGEGVQSMYDLVTSDWSGQWS